MFVGEQMAFFLLAGQPMFQFCLFWAIWYIFLSSQLFCSFDFKVCQDFLRGKCKRSACRYSHVSTCGNGALQVNDADGKCQFLKFLSIVLELAFDFYVSGISYLVLPHPLVRQKIFRVAAKCVVQMVKVLSHQEPSPWIRFIMAMYLMCHFCPASTVKM